MRSILGNIGVHVIPKQVAISKAHEVFGANGQVNSEYFEKEIKSEIDQFVKTVKSLSSK